MLLKERKMKRTYTDQNPREIEFLAKIGDRELTPEEKKQLQKIRQFARQYQWTKAHKDIVKFELPHGDKAKIACLAAEKDLGLYDCMHSIINAEWAKSGAYRAILELYNHLDLSSEDIDQDLADDRLKLVKVHSRQAWVYDNKGGIYIDNKTLLSPADFGVII